MHGGVKRIEIFAEPQRMELVASLLHRLRHRRPDAAAFVAQQAEQTDRRAAHRQRRIEIGRDIRGRETYRQPHDQHDARPDDLPRADIEVHLRHPVIAGGHRQHAGARSASAHPCPRPSSRPTIGHGEDGEEAGRRHDQPGAQRIVAEQRLQQARQRCAAPHKAQR